MSIKQTMNRDSMYPSVSRRVRGRHTFGVLCIALVLSSLPAFAEDCPTSPPAHEQEAVAMPDKKLRTTKDKPEPPMKASLTNMDSMQGGSAPPDARDLDGYSDGYEYTGMPGLEKWDQIVFGKLLLDELEFLSGNEGAGVTWSVQGAYGGDFNKLWLRSQGLKIDGQEVDPTTDIEVLWWRASSPFWGTVLGARRDLGPGAHTWLAFGIEGLAPFWFEVQATGYLGDDGRLSARLKASYDLLFTNRLVLTPELESNVYSRAESDRGLGKGLGNMEVGLRLRYELHRKFAPYIGFVWERSLGDTAHLRRAEGEPVTERRFVAGVRLWR